MRASILVLAVACSTPAHVAPSQPAPKPVSALPPAPDPYVALNLGFEAVTNDHPSAWSSKQADADWSIASDQVHGGTHSLRLKPAGDFVAAATSLPATALRGKHVRMRGWIRTDDVTQGAALWLRADTSDNMVLDNMGETAPRGTTPWREAVVEIDVPADAKQIYFGAFVSGKGTAWFDDLRIETAAIAAPHPIELGGTVVLADGKPAAGAEVALVGAQAIEHHVTADATGHWKVATMSGKWGLSAATAMAAGFIDGVKYDADTRTIELRITGGVTVHGHTSSKPLAGTFIALSMPSKHDADVFAIPVAADGTFTTQLPRGDTYAAEILDKGIGQSVTPVTGDSVDITVPLAPLAPAPQEVIDWIGAHAFALATTDADKGIDDLAPLATMIGAAHVVALGEATHGTREFFQLKHRALEFLVDKLGFTVFAIEANQPECRAIDDYIIAGKGDAKTALAGIYFWTWNTAEVLDMIEWMRTWNKAHAKKLHFTGFDMQTSKVAHANVIGYLKEVGADGLAAPIAVLGGVDAAQAVPKLAIDERNKISLGLAAVRKAFDGNRKAWTAKHTTLAFDDARHDVTILEQALALYSATDREQFGIRDRSMADNIDWLRTQAPKGTRMMVWAHNGHVANTLAAFPNMGGHLRKRYGRDYENIGFVFGDGGFRAMDGSQGRASQLANLSVGPAPDTDGSAAFMRTGKPLLVLDLHQVPATGAVHDWFTTAHPFREIGAVFFNERGMASPMTLPELYDAVIFVAHTTAAKPVP